MTKATPESDHYLSMIREHWAALTGMYVVFEDSAPVMELDVTRGQIRAYPAQDYLDDLTDRSREMAKKQYALAKAQGAFMVFVRDEAEEVLRSYVFPPVEASATRKTRRSSRTNSSSRRRRRRG